MIRVFIGYDPKETVAYNVLAHSINARSSQPASICPVSLNQLALLYRRKRGPLESTEFSFSRFLVPHICEFKGWAIFMDCDMLMLDDIAKLWALRDDRYAVQVVKHNHAPSEDTKFLANRQTRYQKKNWSSVMLMNCEKCAALTHDLVNMAAGLDLHQFKWLKSDDLIGELPPRWNHLVDYDDPSNEVSLVHYTAGGPYFNETKYCGFSYEWSREKEAMLSCKQTNSDS